MPQALECLSDGIVIIHLAVVFQKHKPIDQVVCQDFKLAVGLIPLFILIVFLNIGSVALIVIIDEFKEKLLSLLGWVGSLPELVDLFWLDNVGFVFQKPELGSRLLDFFLLAFHLIGWYFVSHILYSKLI